MDGDQTEKLFRQLLSQRKPDEDLTGRDKKRLRQPVTRVRPDNIFTWHLNQHTIFEDETDPKLLRAGGCLKRVGVLDAGRLSEDQIAAEEARLGIRLPDPWREVYRHFNGGWVHSLYWGDMHDPHLNDIEPIPQSSHEYLALEDVAPLREILPAELDGLDCSRLDEGLIAIACKGSQAVLLDYRQGGAPRVCRAYFSQYDDDPLAGWEADPFTAWWPDMQVFFRGLFLQDRII